MTTNPRALTLTSPEREAARAVAERVQLLSHEVEWERVGALALDADLGFTGGMARNGNYWWVTSTLEDRACLSAFTLKGALAGRWVLTRGIVGGFDVHDGQAWIPVTREGRSAVYHVELGDRPEKVFEIDGELAAVARTGDSVWTAWTRDSRKLLRLDSGGRVLAERDNPSCFVGYRDIRATNDGRVICTGTGQLQTIKGAVHFDGLAVLDVNELSWNREVPMVMWSPTGRSGCARATHIDVTDNGLVLYGIPDDGRAQLYTWLQS